MIKILFICHGNICRSPMAEFVMKQLVADAGRENEFEIASAAVSTEELGNPVYPPVRRLLESHGIDSQGKYARQVKRDDYKYYDLLIVMDRSNIRNLNRIIGGDPSGKVRMLMEYTGTAREVADPWYTGEFDSTWRDVNSGCEALLAVL